MTADPWEVATEYGNIAATAARRYRVPGQDRADLFQMGMIALHAAALDFDPARGAKFSTFAWYKVASAMRDVGRRGARWSREAPAADDADEPAAPEAPGTMGDDGRARLLAAIRRLDGRGRAVIRARYGLGGGGCRTLRDAGAELGWSYTYVGQIERKALKTLAAILGDDFDG